MNKTDIISLLGLQPHPKEGGYFKRTYESEIDVNLPIGQRKLLTSIFYALTDDKPIGYLHKNESDIIHYYQLGDPIDYLIVYPDGRLEQLTLGPKLNEGQLLQLTVKGGCWKGSKLTAGEFGVISEAVSPGFDYLDNTLASFKDFAGVADGSLKIIAGYIKPNLA